MSVRFEGRESLATRHAACEDPHPPSLSGISSVTKRVTQARHKESEPCLIETVQLPCVIPARLFKAHGLTGVRATFGFSCFVRTSGQLGREVRGVLAGGVRVARDSRHPTDGDLETPRGARLAACKRLAAVEDLSPRPNTRCVGPNPSDGLTQCVARTEPRCSGRLCARPWER